MPSKTMSWATRTSPERILPGAPRVTVVTAVLESVRAPALTNEIAETGVAVAVGVGVTVRVGVAVTVGVTVGLPTGVGDAPRKVFTALANRLKSIEPHPEA